MFAVKGWTVDASSLQRQKQEQAGAPQRDAETSVPQNAAANDTSNSKKRKRGKNKEKVNANNFADLWDKHIEHHEAPASKSPKEGPSKSPKEGLSKKEKKRLKRDANQIEPQVADESNDSTKVNGKEKYGKRKEKAQLNASSQDKASETGDLPVVIEDGQEGTKSKTTAASNSLKSMPVPPPPATSNLTPLQSSMRQKLISSRFRHLNEVLYTTPSKSSLDLFNQNPGFFSEYHEGFRRQVTAWPENPVDGFLRWIRDRGRAKSQKELGSQKAQFRKQGKNKKSKGGNSNAAEHDPSLDGVEPLPRNYRTGVCTIADLGCGDAQLAQSLTTIPPKNPSTKALKLQINSYDLAAATPLVTVADISSIPVPDGSVDVAIFSLALMGTNWIDFIEETYRILRWKGECWISEVNSRFAGPKERRVAHSVGNRTKGKAKCEKGDKDEEDFEVIEEEGVQVQNRTDVTAFVAVLKRRGLILQGEPDLSNKMFVRMRFMKVAPAAVGKCAKQQDEATSRGKKFLDQDANEVSQEEEARVLKPCVYKTR